MPSLIDMRRRIRAVKSTQQITKAMKMVAASKLRRAQERVVAARPFASEARRVLASLATRVDPARAPAARAAAGRGARADAAHRDHVGPRPLRQLQHEHRQGGRRVPARQPRPRGLARPGRPQGPRSARAPRLPGALRAHEPAEGDSLRRGGGDRGTRGEGLHRRARSTASTWSTTSSSRSCSRSS